MLVQAVEVLCFRTGRPEGQEQVSCCFNTGQTPVKRMAKAGMFVRTDDWLAMTGANQQLGLNHGFVLMMCNAAKPPELLHRCSICTFRVPALKPAKQLAEARMTGHPPQRQSLLLPPRPTRLHPALQCPGH